MKSLITLAKKMHLIIGRGLLWVTHPAQDERDRPVREAYEARALWEKAHADELRQRGREFMASLQKNRMISLPNNGTR